MELLKNSNINIFDYTHILYILVICYNYEYGTSEINKKIILNRLLDNAKASYIKHKSDGSIEVSPTEYSRITRGTKSENEASILPALCKSFGRTFLFGTFLKVIEDCLVFVSPQVLK